jgi:hypothetical protein
MSSVMPTAQLLIGTNRGLLIATSNESRDSWSLSDIKLKG